MLIFLREDTKPQINGTILLYRNIETAHRGGLSNPEFLQENSRILGKSIKNADALFSGG
jgi:hypothetical protein